MRKTKVPRPIEGLPLFPAPQKKTKEELDREFIARTGLTAADYDPYHPWYHKLGGRILTVDEIEPMPKPIEGDAPPAVNQKAPEGSEEAPAGHGRGDQVK